MSSPGWQGIVIGTVLIVLAALFPLIADGYWMSVGVTIAMYTALATR